MKLYVGGAARVRGPGAAVLLFFIIGALCVLYTYAVIGVAAVVLLILIVNLLRPRPSQPGARHQKKVL